MTFARWYPTTITLPNGETLIHGGRDQPGQPMHTPEIFVNGTVRPLWNAANEAITSDAEGKWYYPRDFVAPNGRVFGMSGNQMYFLDWAGNGGTQLAGNLPDKTRSHTSTAVMYRPGKVFQAGGTSYGDTQALGSQQAVSVDVTSGWPQVTPLPDMRRRRVWANSTVLPTGNVFVSGGSAYENKLIDPALMAEMWSADTHQFRDLRPAALARMYHSISLLLKDGSVLTGGGGAPGPLTNLNAEIYYPPYLFDGNGNFAPRPVLGNFNPNMGYGTVQEIPFSNAVGISRVTFVRLGSVTHSFDTGQRFIEGGFQQVGNRVRITFPLSRNNAPPGFYYVFIFNKLGVPSVAKIFGLEAAPVPAG
ncbi:MAG: DUF1929 domain-containing protein [Pseudomonas sp.]|nr:MAG: DUF1929 domain-containing protein [Pseudomonas sp.]